ncbi:hypothetical protein L1F30_05705 [Simiduia sp. 21SJ11W-1]|uniref:hypothetical protein n=1 Tax=Simiduia sp. 21SJ11W-1 TaxID=2909669 RepID=UPI0020A047CD|nr:hypothetical protein [Simiduia sp. 21SJ11W-1]UTA49042.1 hypothetical protein L1F30_05705 [Simiduia sp. 21SJ11W-1]
MSWIARYIAAARPFFPAASREDLCEELGAQLNDQLEELQAQDPNAPNNTPNLWCNNLAIRCYTPADFIAVRH